MRFMAMARVSWASAEIEPYDMAPVLKRLTIADTGSTSSIGTGLAPDLRGRPDPEQAPQGAQPGRLVVDRPGVLLEDVVAAGPGGVLQLVDRGRVEQVELALPPPLVLAADLEVAVGQLARPGREGPLVAGQHLGGDLVQADPADAADRAR